MKYLFFDIECCDGKHICEFGYVLINDKFEVLEKDCFLINPQMSFRLTGRKDQRDLKLHFTEEEYYNSPLFLTYYNRIKNQIEATGQRVIGHAISNDADFLRTACRKYKCDPINFIFYDSQRMYAEFFNDREGVSLENAGEKLHLEKVKYLHKSDDDALLTMRLVQSMCGLMETSLEEFLLLCPTAKGESKDNQIHYFSEDFNEIVKALAVKARWVSNGKRDKCIKTFIEKAKPQGDIVHSFLTGKNICVSPILEREQTILCLKFIQLIVNHGGIYNRKVSLNQFYVKDDMDDAEKVHTRYYHVMEVIAEKSDLQILSYDEFLSMLQLSWADLEKMPLPNLPNEDKKKGKKTTEGITNNAKGATIGALLAAQGIKLDTEEEE